MLTRVLPQEQAVEATAVFQERVRERFAKGLLDEVVASFELRFTHEEILRILEFYKSPVGRKLAGMPLVQQILETGEELASEILPPVIVEMISEYPALVPDVGVSESANEFFAAIARDDRQRLREMLGNYIDARDMGESSSPVLLAAGLGRLEVLKILIDAGFNVNKTDDSGGTALMAAMQMGHLDIAEYLLEVGADVSSRFEDGTTVLMGAAAQGRMEVLGLLLEVGGGSGSKGRSGDDRSETRGVGGKGGSSTGLAERGC